MGDVSIIILQGRIDASNAADIEEKALALVSGGSCKLVKDLSGVEYISSAGLRVLMAVLKAAKGNGGDLRLAGVQENVAKVLELTGFSNILKIYDGAENAARSYSE